MKKLISVVLAFSTLAVSCKTFAYKDENLLFFDDVNDSKALAPSSEWEPLDDVDTNYISDTSNLQGTLSPSVITKYDDAEDGYQRITEVDSNGNEISTVENSDVSVLYATATELPSSYDARDKGYITSVKNQANYGTCWAHSTAAAFETSMIKNGYEGSFINYSETHLGYFCHSKDEKSGDGAKVYNSTYGYYAGGNPIIATFYLENGEGVAYESEYSYPPADKTAALPEADRFISHASINAMGRIYNTTTDSNAKRNSMMKQAIIDHGGVCVAYYETSVPLSENNAYYQSEKNGASANHSVFVVGWDDNYSVDNFRPESQYRPSNPGAWLVKGSYGAWNYDEGYMWLSYEEPSIRDVCWLEAGPVNNKVLHSYNGASVGAYYTNYTANVFEVTEDETLTELSFNTYTASNSPSTKATFQIRIYDEKPTGPVADGYILAKQFSIDVTRDGLYRASLPNAISVTAGQYVSVVQMNKNSSGYIANHYVEYGPDFSSNRGESYIYVSLMNRVTDGNGKIVTGWIDMRDLPDDVDATTKTYSTHNADMKLYGTTNTATVTFDTRIGTTIEPQTVNCGGTATQPEDPAYAGYTFLGWYSNTTATKAWDFDTPITSDITLYAKWTSPYNYRFVTYGMAFPYKTTGTRINFGVIGKCVEKFDVVFYRDKKYYGKMANRTKAEVGSFLSGNIGLPEGEYYAKGIVYGINGEELETAPIYFRATTEPFVTKYGPYMSVINMDTTNLPLVIGAAYDQAGVLASTTTAYSPATLDVSAANYQIQLKNNDYKCNFFMWDSQTMAPLCISTDAFEAYANEYLYGKQAEDSTPSSLEGASPIQKVKSVPRGYFSLEENILEFIEE